MNSFENIATLRGKWNLKQALLLMLLLCTSFTGIKAQEFQFIPDVDNEIFKADQHPSYTYLDPIYPSGVVQNLWSTAMVPDASWPTKFQFKSVTNVITVGINHDIKTIHNNYKYKLVLNVRGYTLNGSNAVVTTDINGLEFILEYNKDSLVSYKDANALKLKNAAFFKMDVYLVNIYDISNPSVQPGPAVPYASAEKNFYIESSIITQRYDKQDYKLFINSQPDLANHELNVNWTFYNQAGGAATCASALPTLDYKPVKYELEWTYVDDYQANDFNNTTGSYGYKNTGSSFSIPYDFRNNATRIQTYEKSFKIPIIYEHGTIVFRIRTIRPDPTNYSKLLYSAWNITTDAGTITQNTFVSNPNTYGPYKCKSQCICQLGTAMENDKFDWQYSINFAEEGKYKHVLNYFDGAGRNRQTLTKINSDNEYIIGADHIYDFEGRPSIQTLPVPLQSQNLDYKSSLSWKAGTTSPYRASDFDKGCLADSIYGFDVNSYAGKYYSPSNPDKVGMQQFVPDAEGYPFIETIYSPDNTNKVIWQGGAGYNFQRFKRYGIANAYVRANQEELNRLFGTQAGRNEYYPKVITKDPNGQVSYSIFNQGGKVVATALVGSGPVSDSIPVVPLDGIPSATSVTSDILANLTQSTGDGLRSANYPFFPEAGGDNSWRYHGAISPYPTGCGSFFLNAQGFYKIKVVDECGAVQRSEDATAVGISSIAVANTKQYFTPPAVSPFNLVPAKYTLIKELYFPDTTLVRLADTFTRANSGIGKCYDYEDSFIRRSVDKATFPCKKDSFLSHCDEMKRMMMDELYPGAKYGGYNKSPGGGFASGKSNSIFTQIGDDGVMFNPNIMYPGGGGPPPLPPCYYKKQCSYENGGGPTNGNGNSLYMEETIIEWNPGDTLPTPGVDFQDGIKTCHYTGLFCTDYKFRYQWNCAALPNVQWPDPNSDPNNPTINFGPANGAPPDVLIQNFNDKIAEKLLVYHPEYCKLLLCDDHLEDILRTITDYKDAKALGLNTLQKILNQDVLCYNATLNPNGPVQPSELSKLSIGGTPPGSAYLLQPLDKLSLEKAYCGCESPEAYAYCRNNIYASQIAAMNVDAADTQVQNAFIRNLIAMYIGNRNLIRQKLMDAANGNCAPCPEKRMTLTGTPVFTPVFNGGAFSSGLGFPPEVLIALNGALNGTGSNPPPAFASDMEASQRFDSAQVLHIINKLSLNCVFPGSGTTVKDALFTYLLTVCGINGEKVTPEMVRAKMVALGIPVDGLCNPYLAQYGIFDFKQQKPEQKYANKDAQFYADFNTFLNRTEIKTVLTSNGGSGGSLILAPGTNKFDKELAATLGWNASMLPLSIVSVMQSVNDPGFLPSVGTNATTRYYLKLLVQNPANGLSETMYFTKRVQIPCNSNTTYDINIVGSSASQFSFTDAHSVLNDVSTIVVSDGLIADNLAFATLNGFNGSTGVCDNYTVWTAKTAMMDIRDPESLDDCINCVQMKQAVDGYYADAAAFGMPVIASHPNFQVALANYMNFKLKKKHSYYDYEKLMQGCALSNRLAFKRTNGEYHLKFTSGLAADAAAFTSALNTATGNASVSTFSYKDGSDIHLWVNLGNVPEDYYREAEQLAVSNANYISPSFSSNLFMEVLIPENGCGITPSWGFLPANASASSPSTIKMKDLSGSYSQDYTRYTITGAASFDEKGVADVIAAVRGYFAAPATACPDVMFLESRKVMRDSNYYYNTDKLTYLDYIFGLATSGQSPYDISNNAAPGVLQGVTGSGLAPFSAAQLISYKSPWCGNVKNDLYYGPNPTLANPGWDTLNKIITCVKINTPLGLGTGKLFLAPADNIKTIASSTLGNSSSLKAIKMSNGWSWFRLFNNQNRLYNVYLIPAPNMLDTFSYYSVAPGAYPEPVAGEDNLYRFKIRMVRQTTGMTDPHYVTCYGFTDFPLGTGKVLKNVVLGDGNSNPACLDTFPCERNTMAMAIMQGKAMYAAYMDSIKDYHYAKMKSWFPENTVDTLDFSTWKQQYQYTLYNYDLAGNLTSTVPPEGVVPMTTNFSGVDNARNTGNVSPSYYPPFLALGNLNGGKKSEYYYNSFNQLIKQSTPDGGVTNFYYDKAGRLVFSQNAKQAPDSKFSYTLYDNQGRICETGVTSFPGTTISAVINSGINTQATITSQVRGRPREDVVATFYDEALLTLNTYTNEGLDAQENLRKRVSSILYIPLLAVNNSAESFYSYGTHFSYDALGNVKTLVQDNPYMNYLGQRFKRVDYDYDLLSGKVNMVSYNRGKADQFYQKYDYDADNRIMDVQTSNDALVWDRDAHYDYYKHGPLSQVEIGNLKVQSLQYAYTIQGWLKAINGDVLDSIADMGQDGKNGGMYPRDVVAHALDYHPGDYKPIGSRQVEVSSNAGTFYKGLYNGNIARQTTGIHSLDNLQRTYTYDQLNRIKQTVYDNVNNLTHAVTAMANANAYANSYQYDKDGNIKKLTRRDGNGNLIDDFTYNYINSNADNRLGSVSDAAANTPGGNDLQSGQGMINYSYDAIGNLAADIQGNIQNIKWNQYGKVTDISMNTGGKLVHYDYEGTGNRIRKDVTVLDGGNGMRASDLYVRDASGNILAVYKGKSKITGGLTIAWVNDHINNYHGSWQSPSGYGLAPFLAEQFGNNGQFTLPLLDVAQVLNPEWCVMQSNSLSLNDYLKFSDGLFSDAAHQDISSYFDQLRDFDGGDIIYHSLSSDIRSNFVPVMDLLLQGGGGLGDNTPVPGEAPDNTVALNVFRHLYNDAPEMTNLIAQALHLSLSTKGDDVANTFYSYISTNGNGTFLDVFFDVTKVKPDEAENFIEKTAKDVDIVNQSWLSGSRDARSLLADIIAKTPDRKDAVDFFESYLPQQDADWLANNSSLGQRLNILMQHDVPSFLVSYLDNVGLSAVNTSLQSIQQMTVGNYVDAVWHGVGNGTLNPSYTPPNVNTPDSSNIANDTIYLAEHHLYGSSRLGIKTYDPDQYRVIYKGPTGPGTQSIIEENTLGSLIPWYNAGFADWIKKDKTTTYTGSTFNIATDSFREIRTLGAKQYELSDHLGNVLVTVLDKKTGYGDSLSSVTGLHYYKGYWANLSSVTDYYPFGMQMPGRSLSSSFKRFGFNGKENDDEVYGVGNYISFDARGYDSRIARWTAVDPEAKSFPFLSPYNFCGNNPIMNIDDDGKKFYYYSLSYNKEKQPVLTLNCIQTRRESIGETIGQTLTVGFAYNNPCEFTGDLIPPTWNEYHLSTPDGASYTFQTYMEMEAFVTGNPKSSSPLPDAYGEAVMVTVLNLLAQQQEMLDGKFDGDASPELYAPKKIAAQNKASQQTVVTENTPASPKPYSKSRPSYGKGQVEQVWESNKQPNGKVYDPNTGVELKWNKSKPRNGQWDMGHKPGQEYRKLFNDFLTGRISRDQFLKEYRNPNNYHPESPSSNRSRKFEDKKTNTTTTKH